MLALLRARTLLTMRAYDDERYASTMMSVYYTPLLLLCDDTLRYARYAIRVTLRLRDGAMARADIADITLMLRRYLSRL